MRQLLVLVIDLILIVYATAFAVLLRDNLEISEARFTAFAPHLFLTLGVAFVVLPGLGTNRAVWRFSTIADYLRILIATAAIVGGAVALGFGFNRMDGVPRALPILQGLLILFALVGVRISRRLWRVVGERPIPAVAAKGGAGYETILVVGLGRLTDLYLRAVAQFAPDRLRIAGLLASGDPHVGRVVRGHSIVGTPERVAKALRILEIHGVFVDRIVVAVAFEKLSPQAQEALLDIEKATNINVEFLVEQMGLGPRSSIAPESAFVGANASDSGGVFHVGDDDLAALKQRPYWRIRRVLDVVGALGFFIVLSPVMLFVAIVIAIDVGLPVVFWQQRPGLNGRPFKLYKFRTMAAAHKANGERTPDDERTSGIGRFMRLTRLDELPQLFNILNGEMSFIGPRPLLPVDQPAVYAARLLVRPGLTGWAQVIGGRVISATDKTALDVWYVRNASLALDLEIVVLTISVVFFGERVDGAAIRRAWDELRQAGVCGSPGAAAAEPSGLVRLASRGETEAAA